MIESGPWQADGVAADALAGFLTEDFGQDFINGERYTLYGPRVAGEATDPSSATGVAKPIPDTQTWMISPHSLGKRTPAITPETKVGVSVHEPAFVCVGGLE